MFQLHFVELLFHHLISPFFFHFCFFLALNFYFLSSIFVFLRVIDFVTDLIYLLIFGFFFFFFYFFFFFSLYFYFLSLIFFFFCFIYFVTFLIYLISFVFFFLILHFLFSNYLFHYCYCNNF